MVAMLPPPLLLLLLLSADWSRVRLAQHSVLPREATVVCTVLPSPHPPPKLPSLRFARSPSPRWRLLSPDLCALRKAK